MLPWQTNSIFFIIIVFCGAKVLQIERKTQINLVFLSLIRTFAAANEKRNEF